MTAFYSDDQIALHHGDALDVARELQLTIGGLVLAAILVIHWVFFL